ncbi:MAG TPA: methyltransferase domain-containing protein [Anaerolineales bacterium]|nr:methyltransferase domain-containing protein [Anaerolineales bacterium]
MNRTDEEIRRILSSFRPPERAAYPELDGYSRDDIYRDFFGGGGLYLTVRMIRALHLKSGQEVLDLGCGKGETSVYMAQHCSVQVKAVDLWTTAEFLTQKFAEHGVGDRASAIQMDATGPLPYAQNEFDAIFCLNSFNFYGAEPGFLPHLLNHLKPGGKLCIGSEVLSCEFTAEQLANPPFVYAFNLPVPNEQVNVFEGDFSKQHSPTWWRDFFENSGLMDVETCYELDDAEAIYQELTRYEYENNIDPFDVQILLDQLEWGYTQPPHKSLFVLCARKR